MNFEEYEHGGRVRYLALVDAIQTILRHALKQHGLTAHAITGRAKELTSLSKKLDARGIALDQPMDEIKDLAGCRIVFLTNSQVDDFNNTRLLAVNFEILNVNVHHPVPGTSSETKLFDSTNYLVRLKSDRLALPEYRNLDGLCAEIQVQTLLNHAWAEMGHDTIYKEPTLKHLGKARMTEIGERMNRVMQDHLVPAGHDFDKIAKDFRRLLEADDAVETTLHSIYHADNCDDLDEALVTYAELILPHFDEPVAELSKFLDALVGAVERSRGYVEVPIGTLLGELPGKSSLDVARRVAGLIDVCCYWQMNQTFRALIRLYLGSNGKEERGIWIDSGEKFAEHNLDVWQQCGPAAQQTVLEEIKLLEKNELNASRSLLIAMLAKILSPDVSGVTSRSDSVTLHQGVIPVSEGLRRLREESIDWLEQWLDAATSDAERRAVLQALGRAVSVPMWGGANPDLLLMQLQDGVRLARLIITRASCWGLELRRSCEVQALETHHCFHVLPKGSTERPEIVARHKELLEALLEFRDQLATDEEFILYKTLIGHDTVHPDAWDGGHFDYQGLRTWRLGQYATILASVTSETASAWNARIDAYVDAVGNDGGHLQPMRGFLGLLSEQKPDVALLMLNELSKQKANLLVALCLGLDRAGRKDEVGVLFDRWLSANKFLPELGNYLACTPEPDSKRLQDFVRKAIEQGDRASVVCAATAAAAWYQQDPDRELIDAVLMPAIQFASALHDPYWIKHLYTMGNESILHALSEQESQRILESFLDISEVEYWADRILSAIGVQHPHLVVDFFDARMRRNRNASGERFAPIPRRLHDLAQALSPHFNLLLSVVRQWYEIEPRLHQFRGARLLKNVFPDLSDEIKARFVDLARHGDERDFEFILKTLSPYDGAECIYPICMEIVDRLGPDHELLTQVSHVLDETGMVTGEFGFVEARAVRQALIERYRDDPRPHVQSYARDRYRELGQDMAWEQRRADREIAQRRRDWNEE